MKSPNVGAIPAGTEPGPAFASTGEGIGLSIASASPSYEASLEVHTDAAVGTTFRVLFPLRYDA